MSDNPFALSNIDTGANVAPPDSSNPFSLGVIQRDQEQDLRVGLQRAVRQNPDQAARAAQLAKQYPVPADVLARNLMDVELQAAVDKADATLRTSPKLAEAMRQKSWLAPQAHDDVDALAKVETRVNQRADRTAMGTLGDVGVVALKGAVGLPQAFVGLADILTGGYAGRGVEALGVRFAEAQKLLDTLYSPAQQQANEAVREADGFINTLGAMLSNPSTITTTVGESLPQMVGGAAIGRGLVAAAPKLAPWLAAAFGEGLMGAGASAEQIRSETDDGLLSAKQVFASTMSGAGTALFGAVGGRTAQRLGLGDIDTALVNRGVDQGTAKVLQRGFATRIAGAGISEGVFEELPQSVQEQLWQNWATDRPLGEGVGKAAAQGLLAGLSMGGGFQAVSEAGATLQRKLLERENATERAQTESQRLADAFQAAAESKLRERNPETFQQLVDTMATEADGAPQSVFIDAQVLLQSSTPEQLAQILPSTVEQLQEAAASGSTVEVPVAEALTYATGTPLEQALVQNARSAPDALSLTEVQQSEQQAQQFITQEAERVMQQAQDQQAWQQSSQAVQQTVLDQLNATGRFTSDVNEAYATLTANFFSTMAARLGITPQEMYDRYNLKVAAKAVGQGGVLNADQTTTPEFRTWFGESKVTDEQGAPLVVYHGTNQNITAFDSSKIGARDAGFFGSGFYFTPDQDAALDYADSAVADTGQGEAVALSTYVSLQNPFVWDMSDEGAAQTREALATFGIKRESVRGNSAALSNSKEREQFNRAVRAAGYDGVVVRDEDGVQEVVAFEPTQIKSATDNQGTFSAESANILEQSVSTRLPTAKKALENPLEEMLVIGLDAAKADPKAFEKNVELIRQYLNFRDNKSANTPDKAAEQFIRHNVDNLLWLYDQVPAETRERSKLWYDGARAIVDRWVPKYNVSDAQASGMLAVLSPQKDWFQNVSLAERVLDIMATQQDFTWSDEMSQTAAGLAALNPEDVGEITGKTLGEIDSDYLQAIWVRVYDQTYNERGYRVVSPEGDFTDWVYNADGTTKSKTAWGSFNEIGKAISIYKDGSIANISAALGEQHKVRNFYNNIFNPASQHGDVTIDTHAVAAGLLRPLSGSATEVLHNFGAGGAASSSVFGSKGTYGIYAEAYRRAAEQRGVLPREMQSITWEAVHGLYTAGFKAQASNVAKIDAIWENYKKRRISLDDARKQLLDAAGRINPPEWERPGDGPSAPAWASSYTGELRQDGGPAGTAGRGDGGLPFDAAAGVLNQDGPLLAPNGQPSNLTPELHRLVRTPEFKAWFGDWEAFAGMQGGVWNDTTNSVSKAVDENGEPLVVYHGTDKGGFNTFNTPGGTERGDLGIFLTPNRAMAASYVKRGRGGDFSRDEVLTFNNAGVAASGVYPLFVNIRNPYETDFEGALWTGERLGQYSAIDANGETIYAEDGRAYFDNYEDAQALISGKKGASVEGAADHWETTDSAVREARSNDNDGTVIRNVVDDGGGNSTYMGEPSDVFVAFDPTQIKSVENFGAFNPNDPDIYQQGPRGTFSPEQLLVTLNENADLSTFLHESGHFYLEVLADLASQPNAPQQIKDDMAQVLKWFGVPDLATWNGYTLDQKRQYHERWAESFEQYLFEGKAPNQELQPLFRRFRSWLVNVYKSLTQFMRGRNLKLNDEVRQVFDRLVATDEQIAQAEEAAGMLPDFEATNEAIEQLQARSLRDLKWTVKARGKTLKALEKEAATLRKELEAEVRAEVEQQPLYKAINWLKKGETTDPETGDLIKAEKGYRLSTAALAEMYPDTMLGRPDLKGLRGMTGKEGLHPDMAADMFGFESGDVLVRSILDAEPIASVIEGMTDQRMLERHGDLATPEAREAAANEAVHNEARARSLATELKSQADMMNQRQDTGRTDVRGRPITVNAVVEAAKQFALNLAARRRLKDLKNAAWQHRSAEARAGKRWQQLTAEGKSEEAVQAKRDQLLNNYAAKALQDAQVEVRKTLEFFKRVVKGSDEKVVERGRDPDVVNAMRAILAAYDVAPRLEKSALAYMETVSKNDPAMYAALKPSVDGALLNAKPLTELTLEELRGLNDELRAMWVLAKRSRQMEVDGNLMDIEEAADELVTRMDVIGIPDTIPGEKGAITNKEEAGIKLRFALSILTRVEQWAERLDGRFGGPFLRLVFQPVKDAADRFRTDRVSYRQRYTELLKNVAPMLPPGPIDAPELGYTFGNARDSGAAELLHAILHTGNESNKRKLLLGRGWATQNADGTLDTGRWDAFIERMQGEGKINKAHYDFAQGVWDLLEDMKPLAQETHRKVFGRYFAEVTANEVVTPFGTYRGGYVPAQTDSRLVKDAKLRELAEGENESMAYAFPASPSGFTKARVEYNQPLMLDLRTLAQHMDKVLLFSHMQGAVTDVRRLLTNKRVSYALDRIDPGAYEGMLIPWLNRAARQVVETPVVGDRKLSRFLAASRSRAGMALMFANLSNTFQQITGFSLAAVKVKPALMMKATAEFIADPKAMKTTVAEASPFMKDRMLNEVSAMNDAVEDILVNPTLLEKGQAWTQRHAYFMQAAVDNTMSPIIWTAGYNQAIAEGQSERDAVRFADSVIRQTQGTTLPEDISRFESGPAYGRIFTQFVSYFNMMANTNATAVSQITGEMGLKKGAGKLVYVALAGLLVPIWVAEAIAHAFRGGPEDEDDDGWIDDWLMAVFGLGTLRGLVAQVPIVGQAAQLVVNRFNDNPADDKFSLSPAVSLIESTVSAPASVYKAIVDDGNKQKAVRDVVAAATMITGLPLFAVGRPLGYLAGLADQRIEPTGPADLARGLVTGTASPESKQR